MAKNNSNYSKTVLVTRFSALGDVVISIPVLYSVCRAFPHVHFVMLTRPWPAEAMIQRPSNLTVEGVNLKDYGGLWGMRRLAKELRQRYGITHMADLHSVMRTWAMGFFMRLHGVKVSRIDKGRGEKRALVKGKIHEQLTTSHDRYERVFRALGFEWEESFGGFDPIAESEMVPAKAESERWVAIAPFSQHRGKEYPLPLIEKVVEALTQIEGVTVMLFGGGEKEKKALRPLVQKYEHTVSIAEIKHTFTDEIALMQRCDVMLSMDSANMHLASVANLPVVSVWGATHPYCGFMGWKQSEANAVQLDMPCRPCSVFGQKPCRFGDYRCLSGIDPITIVNQIKKVIYG
ncbi:MAG: glycosyltransferase family 9 protein [Bacteroidales bacterium]|nr:glycosyltransferase family 9 protein [Bacteroidales bacterium]